MWELMMNIRVLGASAKLYAYLYGLECDQLSYLRDTFPIVRRKDEARYGEYRTKRLVLENYERLEPLKH